VGDHAGCYAGGLSELCCTCATMASRSYTCFSRNTTSNKEGTAKIQVNGKKELFNWVFCFVSLLVLQQYCFLLLIIPNIVHFTLIMG
jgi:hypothetical protein